MKENQNVSSKQKALRIEDRIAAIRAKFQNDPNAKVVSKDTNPDAVAWSNHGFSNWNNWANHGS